jgi:hypothetical protein
VKYHKQIIDLDKENCENEEYQKKREEVLTEELKASKEVNDYELAARIIEMAQKSFPVLYHQIFDFCKHQPGIKIKFGVKEDISRMVSKIREYRRIKDDSTDELGFAKKKTDVKEG